MSSASLGTRRRNPVFPKRSHEVLQLRPDDVVEGEEIGFALPGAADDAHSEKALQIAVLGITGDACLLCQGLQAFWSPVQPGEQFQSLEGEDLMQE